MGDDNALIVVAMMACMFSVVVSAGFTYTCTGGTFDLENIDYDKCFTFPDTDGSGGGGGGGGGATNPSSYPAYAEEGLYCDGMIFEDSMTTCYDIDTGEAGVRWEWVDSDDAEECKNKVTKYGIVVSSSQYNHNVKYRFPDVIGRDSNSFKFNKAPDGFLEGQNVKFEITPLNDINEKITNTVVATLDTNNSSEICNAHGDPVDFSSAELLGDVGSKPTLNPTPCEGNTYTPPTECMRDGVVLDGTPGKCGDGLIQWSLDTSAADYVAATDGGECVLAHSRGCHVECAPDAPPPADCNQYVPGWNYAGLGCVKDNFDHNNPPANDEDYVKMGDCYPAGEKDGVKMRYKVATDPINCSNLTEWVACGLTECPVNCVGSWVNDGAEYLRAKDCNAEPTVCSAYMQNQKYVVTQQANATGSACETTNGATRTVYVRGCGNTTCCKCGH